MNDLKKRLEEEKNGMNQNRTLKGGLSIILNPLYFLDKIYISSGIGFKEDQILDPMKKISCKKEF